jgi:hypothetical protein
MPRDANDVMREHGLNALREGLDGALASEGLRRINETERTDEIDKKLKPAVSLDDFRAYMVVHKYIFTDTGDLWPASSVNARIPPVPISSDIEISASKWLDTRQPVEQVTWAPGRPQIIEGQVIAEGGWIDRPGCSVYNFYRPPVVRLGDATKAGQWIDHVRRVYGNEADHIFSWLAHRVQCPGEKLNHALVLGGLQGIGKDTLLEPVKRAVGPWNWSEISPAQLLGRFNGFAKSVILRVSEARDLGDVDRYAFYDHSKVYTAAPPDVIRCDEKNLREHSVPNVASVIITTNHKTDGLFLPSDDRRHFVVWSSLTKEDFDPQYWRELWRWYEQEGFANVAAYLSDYDLSNFDPKAPPPKTAAFWAIVDANRAPEDAELADAIDKLEKPKAVTLQMLIAVAEEGLRVWLADRRNRRQIPHRMEAAGYEPIRNPADVRDGQWKIGGKRHVVYARRDLPDRDKLTAAAELRR